MWLELINVDKMMEKITDRKTEAVLEVREEDHKLTRIGRGMISWEARRKVTPSGMRRVR